MAKPVKSVVVLTAAQKKAQKQRSTPVGRFMNYGFGDAAHDYGRAAKDMWKTLNRPASEIGDEWMNKLSGYKPPLPPAVKHPKGQLPQVVNPAGGLRGSTKPVAVATAKPKPSRSSGAAKPRATASAASGSGASGAAGRSTSTVATPAAPKGPKVYFTTPAQARAARVPGLTLKFKKGAGYYWGAKNTAVDPAVATAVGARGSKRGTANKAGSGSSGGAGGSSGDSAPVSNPLQDLVDFFKSQREQMLSTQTAQQNALSGFTKELMNYLAGVPGQVEGDYNNAISQADQLAQTAATGLANLNPNGAAQSYLSGIGAPDAQRAQVAAQNQNVFGGGGATLYNTAGAIPGTNLAGQKAAQLAFTRQLPQIQALAASQAMKNLLYGQGQETNKFDTSVAENMLTYRQKQQELAQQKLYNDQRIALARNADITKTAVATDKSKQAWARLNQQGNIAAASLQARVASLSETARHNNAMETLAADRIQSSLKKSTKKGLTASQIGKLRGKAMAIARDAYNGGVDADGNQLEPIDYQTALQEMRTGDEKLGSIPLNIALTALNEFYKPGERKRPFLSLPVRQRLARAGVPQPLIDAAMWDAQAAAQAVGVYRKLRK